MKNIKLLLLLGLLFTSLVNKAQQPSKLSISGIVKDEAGTALAGVSFGLKNEKKIGVTDPQGYFKLSAPKGATVVFTYVGYLSKEVKIEDETSLSVSLSPDANTLNEVVVTGFGVKKSTKNLSYAVTEVKGDELTRANNANVVNALQGKVAGVMVNQGASGPQSSSRIRIRGNSTLNNNSQPLVVIDGVLIEPGTTGADSWGDNADFGNVMKDLNPDDYESLSVLKGAAASALYGSKAQNGVLLITTKKGRSRKGLGVNVTHTESYDKAYKLYDMQNEYGGGIYPEWAKDAQGNDVVDPTAAYFTGGYSFGPKLDGHTVKDLDGRMVKWQANDPLAFFQTGKFINTNVAVDGGNDKTTFRLSYTNLNNNSVLPTNSMYRNTFDLRATHKLSNFLSVDASVIYSNNKINNPGRQGSSNNPLFFLSYYQPRSVDLNYYMNNYVSPNGGSAGSSANDPQHLKDPYAVSRWAYNFYNDNRSRRENNLIANVDVTANITPWLNALVRANTNVYADNYERKLLGDGPKYSGGAYEISQNSYTTMRIQGLLNGTRQLGQDLALSFSVGGETYRNNGGLYNTSFTNGGLKIPGLFTITNSTSPAGTTAYPNARKRTDAVYAYGDLTWKEMLTLNFSARNDWSSTLTYKDGHGDYSYFYPGAGLAWTFTELPSFKDHSSIISFGKLRAAVSWTGLDADPQLTNKTGYYTQTGTFNNAANGTQQVYGFDGNTLGNQNLKNQLTREIEVGADVRFFKNRLGFDVAYYKKNSYNQILNLNTSAESGVSAKVINAGNIQNQGIEVLVTGVPVRTKDFVWNASVNFTRNRNKIIDLAPGVNSYQLELAFGADVVAQAIPGKDYGTVVTGSAFSYYQAKDAAGNPVANPSNGKKVLGAAPYGTTGGYYSFMRLQDFNGTQKQLGNIMENFLLATTQEFSYKDFSLSFLIDSKFGGLMASATHQYGSANGSFKNSLKGRDQGSGGVEYVDDNGQQRFDGIIPDGVLNDGITANVNGTSVNLGGMSYADAVKNGYLKPIPAYAYYENLSQWSSGIREYSVFENSWVAMREVSIGYNVKAAVLKKAKISALRVSVTGRNLGYLYKTAKDGINPEGIYSNRSAAFAEYGGWPYVRSLGFTIKASF